MCIDVTTILDSVTAIATVVLAVYNGLLLSRIDKQHQTDTFFRAFPYRKEAYLGIKKIYDDIKDKPDTWEYGNLRDKGTDVTINLHHSANNILSSLDNTKLVFTNGGETKDIFISINDTIDKINEHDSKLRERAKAENIQIQTDKIEAEFKDTHEKLISSYKNLLNGIEEFLKFYNVDSKEK